LRPVRTADMRGRRYKIVDSQNLSGDHLGECSTPDLPYREMFIPVQGDTRDDLAVQIHEMLHACLWDLDEEAVEQTCVSIANCLWRLGWRNDDQE